MHWHLSPQRDISIGFAEVKPNTVWTDSRLQAKVAFVAAILYFSSLREGTFSMDSRFFWDRNTMRRSIDQLDMFAVSPISPVPAKATGRGPRDAPRGQAYDLMLFFQILNRHYLWNRLPRPVLRWSRNRWRIVLGICDVERQVITLNRALDDTRVPDIVVASTLFHEMLHLHFGIGEGTDGRRRVHPPEFKRAEKSLPGYHEAEVWLKNRFPLRGRPAIKPREDTNLFLSLHTNVKR
jgi:hypothetical protein